MPFKKKRLIANSRRFSFFETNLVINDKAMEIALKKSHHKGNRHQSGYFSGEKSTSTLANTRQGNAMSIANVDRKPSRFSGTIFLAIIQNPKSPIPKSAATDSNVISNISILHYGYYNKLSRG